MKDRSVGLPLLLLPVALALALAGGCSNSSTSLAPCNTTLDCSPLAGEFCCSGTCVLADQCATCVSESVAGNWHWEYLCIDTTPAACPAAVIKTGSFDVTIGQNLTAVDVTLPPGEDNLAGTLCGDEYWWAETSVDGTDNGCWMFDAAENQFNQRSTADQGNRLCIGVGYRAGTPAPTIPDCNAILALFNSGGAAAFSACPPAPPGGP